MACLGPWRPAGYSTFDLSSPAYSDLLFFHAVVRQVFFDTNIGRHADAQQNQLRCYAINLPPDGKLFLEGRDATGKGARTEIRDLRLYVSTQGIGVLSIGTATGRIDAARAQWSIRRLRKIFPVDMDSVREGRTPDWLALTLENGAEPRIISEERFAQQKIVDFYPPLANTIKSLLYCADYSLEEYESRYPTKMCLSIRTQNWTTWSR